MLAEASRFFPDAPSKTGDCSAELFYLRYRLIGMGRIGDEPLVCAVHVQVELFQHGLSNEHFIAQNQRLFNGITSEYLDDEGVGDPHAFLSPIGILGYALPANPYPKPLDHLRWDNR